LYYYLWHNTGDNIEFIISPDLPFIKFQFW
jgi:hypothetical protein